VAISDSLRRLLHIRTLEEEQRKLALDSALAELHRLEGALGATRARERAGRSRIALSSRSGDAADRIAGLVECESARHRAQILEARISETTQRIGRSRDEYLAKRVERRQVETVIQEARSAQDAETARREQQGVDEWFSARHHTGNVHRRNSEEPEIKERKEITSIPEEELRSNL
jgi:flagellar export protein FliJ